MEKPGRLTRHVTSFLLVALVGFALAAQSLAGSAQWNASPANADWNTPGNWTPATVPNGASDVATFANSSTTNISISTNTQVDRIVFNAGASAFIIAPNVQSTLMFDGSGIVNNSGITQNFVTAVDVSGNFARVEFTNSSTAGTGTAYTNDGALAQNFTGGEIDFFNSSTAGSAAFDNQGGQRSSAGGGVTNFWGVASAGTASFVTDGGAVSGASGGITRFIDTSSAGGATFITNGATANLGFGGSTNFFGTSSAGNGTFTTNGGTVNGAFGGQTNLSNASTAGTAHFTTNGGTAAGALGGETNLNISASGGGATFISNGGTVSGARGGTTSFAGTSTSASATLIANGGLSGGAGGQIAFSNDSAGGTSQIELFGNGNLDISFHNAPGVSVGSIEGGGNVFLGGNNLTVGTNNRFTTFSGVIQDGGNASGGTGGSLTKTGFGVLTLSGANTYTGGTTVTGGTLLVNNSSGSGTGTSAVQVSTGTLGGTGTIAGAVTVGTGSGRGAFISPGISPGFNTATLAIQTSLTLNSDATYNFELNSTNGITDKIVANGVAINGAAFSFTDGGSSKLALGRTFVILDNTSASSTNGIFNNLADNSIFTNNGNAYQVSYEGGDGNDLTLTVVPELGTWQLFIAGTLLLFTGLRKKGSSAG